MTLRLLDLYCCSGGAAAGYARAGFEVVGVDIKQRPNYPFEFVEADALALDPAFIDSFDAIHASPPCQRFSITKSMTGRGGDHPDLIEPTRRLLRESGKPYVIENVVGAPLLDPFTLCGTMFGLRVYRHRLFETSFFVLVPTHEPHRASTGSHRGYSKGDGFICLAGHNFKREDGARAMDIDWHMSRADLAQAIPPAFTAHIGRFMRDAIRVEREAA